MPSRERACLLLVLLATTLLYLPALSGEFVGFDDYEYVKANRDVQHPDLRRIFDLRNRTVADWTPVVTLSHAVEYRLFGLHPRAYHVTNLLLHLASIVLVYLLLRDLDIDPRVSLLACLVFAIHPLQVETVAWVSSRKNLLVAVFGLGFCRAFLAGRPLTATLLLLLALGSKGTAIVFPLWAAVLWACGFGTLPRRRAARWLALFGGLAALRGLLSVTSQASVIAIRPVADMVLSERMAIIGRVLVTQLRQFFLPYDLCLYYEWSPSGWSDPRVLGAWTLVGTIAGVAFWAARHDVRLGVMGAFIVLGLFPTLNIVRAPYFQTDRYTHLALLGAAVLVVCLLRPFQRVQRWLPEMLLLVWCALVLVPATRARIAIWQNTETMWNDVLRRAPDIAVAWDGIGMYRLEKGDADGAEPFLRRALALQPDRDTARYNLALILVNRGQTPAAINELRVLLGAHPESAHGHQLLGRLLAEQAGTDEALQHLDTALRLDPGNTLARYDRARLLARIGRLDDAAADFATLLREARAAVLLSGLASVRLRQGNPGDAVLLAREATDRDRHQVEAWVTLAEALAAGGHFVDADDALERGLAANPEAAELANRRATFQQRRAIAEGR